MTNNRSFIAFASRLIKRKSAYVLALALFVTSAGALTSTSFAAATPKPSTSATSAAKLPTTAGSAACQKVYKQIVNADNIYVATQYGIIAAAKTFLASGTLVNRLAYNQSFATVFKAANAELNLALKSPKCYTAISIKSYRGGVKSNLNQISVIQNYNINGQVFYDAKKATAIKPKGLLR